MRTFVKVLVAVGVLGAISTGFVAGSDAAVSTAHNRSYVTGKYELQLEGVNSGFATQFYGGSAVADVVAEKLGPDHIQKKHLGPVKYEEISLSVGTGMSRSFYEWIKNTLARSTKDARKSGAVVAMDYNYNAITQLDFNKAYLTEIGFPALDASSKDAARLTVSFAPEWTKRKTLSGAVQHHENAQVQKAWRVSDFRLKLKGLESDLARVNKIEPLVIKQKVVQNPVGELRDYETEPATLEIPNLVFTLPESHAQAVYAWHQSFVIDGNNGDAQEKTGTLELLAPDLKTVYFTLSFYGVGIVRVAPEKVEAGSENIRRVKVTCYVENMTFDYTGGTTH